MIARNLYRFHNPMFRAALFCVLVATPAFGFVFGQDPSGRDIPTAPKKTEAPPRKKAPEATPKAPERKPSEKKAVEKPVAKAPAKTTTKKAEKPAAKAPPKTATKKPEKPSKPARSSRPAPRLNPAVKLTIVAPPHAAVELDGRQRGFTGVDGNLIVSGISAGDHQLSVTADGYEPWSGTFVMSTASTRFEVPIKKKPATGKLAITVNEPGTEILIDEKYRVRAPAKEPVTVTDLLPGVRELRAVKPGFAEWRGTAAVRSNETTPVRIEMRPRLDLEMLRLPEGDFVRGNDNGEKDQRPAHPAYTNAFEISRREVTNRLYKFFVDATGHPAPKGTGYGWIGNNYPEGQDEQPVVFVSWDDAMAFCKWFSLQTGRRYRLPTEAEWEKAARLAGDDYASVGKVWEWCLDWYDPDYYKRRDRLNPQGPISGKKIKMMGREGPTRVMRGGGFGKGSVVQRAAERSSFFPSTGRFDIGFRILREVGK
jgi:formylglycine-generating enzyme required for sulfatase activity